MLLGPVFAAELVTSVRRVRYFLLRGIYGLILLTLVWINFTAIGHWGQSELRQAAQLATGIMASFTWLQLLMILLVAPAMAAGSIATERERRTIEYLFATDLSNAELVLGKTAARLLHVCYLVLIGLPILALVSLLGGISVDLLLSVFSIAVSTMFMVVALSVCVSVWSARARDAVTRVYTVLAALLLLPMMTVNWISSLAASWSGIGMTLIETVAYSLLAINPLWVQSHLMWSGGPAGANLDWQTVLICVGGQTAVAVVCLALATVAVRRVHLAASGKSEKVRRETRIRWRPALGDRPMLWKELFARHSSARLGLTGRLAATGLVVAILAFVGYCFIKANDPAASNIYFASLQYYYMSAGWISVLVGCGGILLVGARAAGSITGEVERDCWVALLSTPLTAREIVVAKVLGSLFAARWIVVLLVWIWGLGILLDLGYAIVVAMQLLVWACIATFASALGVRYSLACSTTLRAMGATLATLVFVGGGYLFCCFPLMFARSDAVLVTAGLVPMLLVLPTISYVSQHAEPQLVPTFILGVAGYAIASLVLIATNITALRWPTVMQIAGVGVPKRREPDKRELPPRPSANQAAKDELVDDVEIVQDAELVDEPPDSLAE